MKTAILLIAALLTSQSALAGNVHFKGELEKRNAGQEYRFIRQEVGDINGEKIVRFQECKAVAVDEKTDQVITCYELGSEMGYKLSEIAKRDRRLLTGGIVEKLGTSAVLIGAGAYVGVVGFMFWALSPWVAVPGAAAAAAGGAAVTGVGVWNLIIDWTPSGSLRASKTISKKADFFEKDMIVKGSLKEYAKYRKLLLKALSKVPAVEAPTAI